DRLAHGTDQSLVLVDAETDLQLDGREPLLDVASNFAHDVVERIARLEAIGAGRIGTHFAAQRPAHQHMDRRLEVTALQIPERDVDPRERGYDEPLLSLITKPIVEVLP